MEYLGSFRSDRSPGLESIAVCHRVMPYKKTR